jgi:DNA invertase Pin-like site-specific DNA recombinase
MVSGLCYDLAIRRKAVRDMSLVGYIRVSTQEQNTARQEEILRDCSKIFTEKVSGKDTAHRTQLRAMMEYVREGDTVVVESYSRFGRNTRDLLNLIAELEARGVAFVSKKEQVDTSTPSGKLMMNIFASLAQFEREQTLERQAEGIDRAKREGKYKGRKPIQIDKVRFIEEAGKWKDGDQSAIQTMKNLGLKPNTFYRQAKALGLCRVRV